MVKNNARHPISKNAVLPIVISIKFVGGGWPIDSALMTNPNWNANKSKLKQFMAPKRSSWSLYPNNWTRLANRKKLYFFWWRERYILNIWYLQRTVEHASNETQTETNKKRNKSQVRDFVWATNKQPTPSMSEITTREVNVLSSFPRVNCTKSHRTTYIVFPRTFSLEKAHFFLSIMLITLSIMLVTFPEFGIQDKQFSF